MAISIHKTPPKRVDVKRYKNATSNTVIYVFDCLNCSVEIRCERKYLKKHSGKCRACCRKGRPFSGQYAKLLDSIRQTNKRRTKQRDSSLTYEEFLEFTKIRACEYCREEVPWIPHRSDGAYRYNLDRKDSSIGYHKTNLVVCCKACNYMKGDKFSYEEFKAIAELLHKMRPGGFFHD